tara:strand:- start:30690 stop:30839 length:150 start_codon:yes stop_codon:yes gene_type:complete
MTADQMINQIVDQALDRACDAILDHIAKPWWKRRLIELSWTLRLRRPFN